MKSRSFWLTGYPHHLPDRYNQQFAFTKGEQNSPITLETWGTF